MAEVHVAAEVPPVPRAARPLRILLVSSSSGSQGGGEFYLVGLAEGLAALGHEVTAWVAQHPRVDALAALLRRVARVERMVYVNTYDRWLRSVGACLDRSEIRRLAAEFRLFQPDVLHVNQQNVEDGLDLVLAAGQSGLPWVSTIHITRSMTALGAKAGWLRDALVRRVLRHTPGHWLTIAETCGDDLQRFLGPAFPSTRLHRVPNGVADVPPGDRLQTRRSWGCRDGDLVLGCVARIESQKNPWLLLRLLRQLPPRVRLVWIGDGRLRQAVLDEAQRLGVAERVHLDGWRDDARQRMSGLDLYVLPSHYEGLPLAVLEAMAAGLPCVASRVDGMGEAILDGVSGLLCSPGDEHAWLAALLRLVGDRALRERLGREARRRYEERFSLTQMARGTVEVYAKVLSENV